MHNKSIYEVKNTDGKRQQLTASIIAANMLSQVGSEVHHYQVLTEVTDNKRYDITITKMDSFSKSSNSSLHWKKATCGWKLLVEWKDV